MDLQADINWIVAELRNLKDPQLIEAFKNLILHRKKREDFVRWSDISLEERMEIEEGIRQADAGEFIPHDQVMKDPKKWL